MKFSFTTSIDKLPNTIIIPIWKSKNTKSVLRQITKTYQAPASVSKLTWSADEKDILTVYAGDRTLHLVGMGQEPSPRTATKSVRNCVHKNKKKFTSTIGLDWQFAKAKKQTELLGAAVNGIVLGRYDNNLYKTNKDPKKDFMSASAKVVILAEKADATTKQMVREGNMLAAAQLRIFDLVNKPANKKIPSTLTALAKRNGKASGYKVKVYSGKEVVKKGLHALHAVGQASPNPSALIIMEYKPKKKAKTKIALIGKGVTFDTGGVSLKPSSNMHLMKSDMGGAAAVLGAMDVIAKMNLNVHVIGVVASAENNIGSTAIKPGDIIDSYSGKTIEVLNTDAEGRLVLADGLAYVNKNYKPDIMIDLATLTGSVVRALGKTTAGLFTKNKDLSAKLYQAGEQTGERLWPMPMWDEYLDEMKSDIADIKNLGTSSNAGAITAAKFLEVFTNEHPNWAHLDIAGKTLTDNEFGNQANATAFGVHLLYHFVKNL